MMRGSGSGAGNAATTILSVGVALANVWGIWALNKLVEIEHRLTSLEVAERIKHYAPRETSVFALYSPHGKFAVYLEREQNMEAKKALKDFDKTHKGKTLTEAQKKQRGELLKAARAEQFKRSVNKQLTTAGKALDRITAAARLPHTKEQWEALQKHLETKLGALETAFTKRGAEGEKKTIEIV